MPNEITLTLEQYAEVKDAFESVRRADVRCETVTIEEFLVHAAAEIKFRKGEVDAGVYS